MLNIHVRGPCASSSCVVVVLVVFVGYRPTVQPKFQTKTKTIRARVQMVTKPKFCGAKNVTITAAAVDPPSSKMQYVCLSHWRHGNVHVPRVPSVTAGRNERDGLKITII